MQEWETRARSWLSSLPKRDIPTSSEMDGWLDSDQSSLPEELKSQPRPQLHHRILSIHQQQHLLHETSQAKRTDQAEPPKHQFQRTDLWIPVYSWLESMDTDEVIKVRDITDWLSENPEVREKLLSKHSRYHLMHYIQKMHLKMLRKQGKVQKDQGLQLRASRASLKIRGVRSHAVPISGKRSSYLLKDEEMSLFRKSEAFLRYELLTDLENQLSSFLLRQKQVADLKDSCSPSLLPVQHEGNTGAPLVDVKREENTRTWSGTSSLSQDVESFRVAGWSNFRSTGELDYRRKRKRETDVAVPAWCHCEALSGSSQTDRFSRSYCDEASGESASNSELCITTQQGSFSGNTVPLPQRNITRFLQGREKGSSWSLECCNGGYAGKNQGKWIPFFEGWNSLGRQFEGSAVWFQRRCYSSWLPTWCAYSSSVAVAQPFGRIDQGVQKVLDVRFHPEGLAQLVCSSNEPPNELLLYNLRTGRAVELTGHNCQIQAVEFAVKGASIVSCGGNLMKVWDSTTGSCLFTFGPACDVQAAGHTKKINAMTVNKWQSCLVATGGGPGDGKLLVWNALTGQLAADLNINLRKGDKVVPSIEVMEFSSQNLLVCGSDSSNEGPAVVQLWDIETPQSFKSLPANDSYISSLKISPDCNTIITGAGNGVVSLFDVRTCSEISHLSLGPNYEVTSVSFSSCGTYFHASSTSNNTLVWDTRLMRMNCTDTLVDSSIFVNELRSLKPLHCLSHGKQMPTAEHAGQLPGHVDEGDQGVNDARWLQREPVLVTVSGDGSIAMWDVTLGQPCVRHLFSHTRCINTIGVAPNDDYLCTGGDDQKVVLYHNTRGSTHAKWRLTHPLSETE